jgi:hypothetical protein
MDLARPVETWAARGALSDIGDASIEANSAKTKALQRQEQRSASVVSCLQLTDS